MKHILNEVRPAKTRSYLKHKLISATALLLVSSIMLVSTSYAWYVLSTAPEVSNIKTQVGANGALEVALLNADSWANLSKLDMGDIDESLSEEEVSATVANLTWGNLVNLDDSSYGLDKIVLQPARLHIMQAGSDVSGEYRVNNTLLKTPIYGEDGRVKGLDETAAKAYTYANQSFSVADDYGVRAIGTVADMSVFERGMSDARSYLVTSATAAKSAASNALQSTGNDLANVVVAYAVSNKESGYTDTDVGNIKKLALGLQGSLNEIENALRQVFAGYLATTVAATKNGITAETYPTKVAELSDPNKTLSALLTEYADITEVVPDIGAFITKFDKNKTAVADAIADCESKEKDDVNDYRWDQLATIILPLVNTQKMMINGEPLGTLKDKIMPNGTIDFEAASALLLGGGGITITMPSESGILSEIADFAGDYTAKVGVTVNTELDGKPLKAENVPVLMTTATEATPDIHLNVCGNGLRAATVAEATGSNSITDYYGYAIDLAFRTNATGSNLQLQTEPENRIYQGENQAALQGGGSYMSFTTSAGLSATKVVRLMSGIRVVFMDGQQNILGIAALDTTLGQDYYTVLDAKTQSETKMYAYLDGSASAYQNSDLIDEAAYNILPEKSKVTFNKTTGKVTAKLYLYEYEMTKSTTTDANGNIVVRTEGEGEDAKILYTGGLTLSEEPSESDVITALTADVPQKVTALVYLDGSVVNNSTVAASSMYSMTGVLNLQFSSSANLVPAVNTQLQTSSDDLLYTELVGVLYQNKYLSYTNGALCKVKDGYKIYEGSDGKLYFSNTAAGGETLTYVELTDDTYTTALTEVTAALSTDTAKIAANSTTDLEVTLSDSNLTVEGYRFVMSSGSTDIATPDTYETDKNTFTVTGKAAGTVKYQAVLTVRIGSGDASQTVTHTVRSNEVAVEVTAASGEGEGS